MCYKPMLDKANKKFLPWGNYLCFHKTGGNFFRGKFPRNFRGECRDRFSRKSFPVKVSHESIV